MGFTIDYEMYKFQFVVTTHLAHEIPISHTITPSRTRFQSGADGVFAGKRGKSAKKPMFRTQSRKQIVCEKPEMP